MTSRYLNYDTHLIDPDINSQRSIEFLHLKNLNIIAKIPYKDKVDVFYKDADNNLLFGTFTLGKNEYYEGTAKVITFQIFQDVETIYVQTSFYKPTEYFYFFYEKNGNIYLRTFKKRQGTFGEEILFFEGATVKSITTSKEAFIVVVNDVTHKSLLQKVKSTIEGELKIVFLMENSISQYENDLHSTLETQVFEIPFGDIPENFFSVPNEVENDVKLYLSNSNQKQALMQDSEALNGFVVRSGAVTEMDHTDSFTIILRYKPFSVDGGTIYETDNFKFLFYPDKLRLILSNGFEYDYIKVTPTTSIYNNGFHAFIFSVNTVGDKYIFSVAETNDLVEDSAGYTLEHLVYQNSSFDINETFLKVGSNDGLDYLAIKNNYMTKNVMEDMLTAMSGNLYNRVNIVDKVIDYTEIEEDRARRILDLQNKLVHVLPNDIITATDDFVIEENGNSYVINSFITVTADPEIVEADIYIYADGVFVNSNIDTGTIYAKNDSIVDANNKPLTIYHEKRATLKNIQNCVLILTEELSFEEVQLAQVTADVVPGISASNYMNPYNTYINTTIFGEGYDTIVEQISGSFSFTPVKRFIDMGDGTLVDTITKTTFSKSPVYVNQLNIKDTNYAIDYYQDSLFFFSEYIGQGLSSIPVNYLFDRYTSAKFEVGNLTISNQTDWRLPTLTEMQGISAYINASISGSYSVLNEAKFGDTWTTSFASCGYLSGASNTDYEVDVDYYFLSSDFFDMDYYNSLPITEKLVKTDLVWIDGGDVFSVSTGEVFSNSSISGCPATLCFPVRQTKPDVGVYIRYQDGTKILLPTDENFYISKQGKFAFEKTHKELDFASGGIQYSKKVFYEQEQGIKYIEHEAHTSSNAYYYGLNVFLNRKSSTKECTGTVFPFKLLDRFGIHRHLFISPEDNLRVCEHFRQRSDLIPFKIDADTSAENIVVWTTLNRLQDKIGFQYGLVRDNIFNNVYDDYEVFNRKVYSQTEYFSAFHFNKVIKENQKLIDTVTVDDNGEIMLIGKTENGTYAREIKKIRFFQRPKRYKSSSIILEVDVADKNNTQSYINNYKSIRHFLLKIINQWKPANIILEDIVEKETLVMAKLLQDEYTQVLVGVTPLGNFNAYYNRTVDNREVSIRASSDIPYDQINWVGIPQLNLPFLKSGVTKVINEKKNIKVTFDSRFSNANYRVFVFAPYDAKFYVPVKDRDGFIVESSSTVREEISWIALATNEISNGSISWVSGVPNGELIVNNLDRVTEISKHSNTYTYDFTSFGYPEMESNDFTVILSTDKNVNVWVENKTSKSFTIRRSYVGDDLKIDWFVVKGNNRWWKGLTS